MQAEFSEVTLDLCSANICKHLLYTYCNIHRNKCKFQLRNSFKSEKQKT